MTEMIEAVPRTWSGIEFRSTLEANWAATLSSLEIKWAYEPEYVDLPSGDVYLPDFKLTEIGAWLEVKGEKVPGIEKTRELAREVVCRCQTACDCPWPGGVIVLIGHEPTRAGQGMRLGAARWSDALGGSVHLILCEACTRYSWVRLRHGLRCRHCQHIQKGGHLIGSGELGFRHADNLCWLDRIFGEVA